MQDLYIKELSNGIRIIHKQVSNTKIAHCGFIFDIGSRDEREDQQGLAHFLEHMAFKGTKKRKSFHIINRLESVGGELNAFTTKEKIFFHASILDKHYERAVELLTDISFNSVFPEKEVKKEKGVILEEMSMYLDFPEEAIVDEFDEVVFKGHSLGNNILGTRESVNSFKQEDFTAFLRENMSSERIVFASVGNISPAKLDKLAAKYFEELPAFKAHKERIPFTNYVPNRLEVRKPVNQAHCILGTEAYSLKDKKRIPFFMLSNLLGGYAMTSRLNMNLRERHGYVYAVDSSFQSYVDTGLFYVYFGTEKKLMEKSLRQVWSELRRAKEKPLGRVQLSSLKEQLCGQLAMGEESNAGLMQVLGKSLLDLDRVETLNEIFDQINSVSALEIQDIANELFQTDRMSMLQYLPES